MLKNKRFVSLVFAGVILTTGFFVAFQTQTARAGCCEGSLFVTDDGTVYVVENGQRRGFPSLPVFLSHGYKFSDIEEASDYTNSLPNGPVMIYADGTLVRASDGTVYLISKGTKRGFTSYQVFLGLGYSARNLISDRADVLNSVPQGQVIDTEDMAHPVGTLISDGGTVYQITETGRKGIPSIGVFNSNGWRFQKVVPANDHDRALPVEGTVPPRSINYRHRPSAPIIDGPSVVAESVTQDFIFSASDPDGDDLTYTIDWGDGSAVDQETLQSERSWRVYHGWKAAGTYIIRARVQDNYGNRNSSDFELTVSTSDVAPRPPFPPLPPIPPPPGPSHLLGDANTDDKVNIADSLAIARHVEGIARLTDSVALDNADVNGDGQITKTDGDLVSNFSVGSIKKFARSTTSVISFSKGLLDSTTVAAGLNNQIIGAFDVTVQVNPVQVTKLVLGINQSEKVTGVIIKDGGKIIAGPFDPVSGKINVTDTIIFQPGYHQYTIEANLSSAFRGGDVIAMSLEAPSVNVTAKDTETQANVTAQPGYGWALEQVLVRTGNLMVSTSPSPAPQTVLIGTSGFTFANFVIDASGSSEDIRIRGINFVHKTSEKGIQNNIANVGFYDGSTALSPIIQPVSVNDTVAWMSGFTFTNPVTVAKGTSKVITLKGDIVGGKNGQTHSFGCRGSACVSAVGVSTGSSVIPTVIDSDGPTMTLDDGTTPAGGSLTVSMDASNPTRGALLVGGSSKVTVAELLLTATGQDLDLRDILFNISPVNGGGLDREIAMVYLYDGATLIASKVPTTSPAITFSSLDGKFRIPKSSTGKKLTVKVDVNEVTNGQSDGRTARSGRGVAFMVNEDAYGAVGVTSGSVLTNSQKSGHVAGNEYTVYKSVPTVQRIPLANSTLANGDQAFYSFKVSADPKGDLGFYKAAFEITASNVGLGTTNPGAVGNYNFYEEYGTTNQVDLTADGPRHAASNGYLSVLFNTSSYVSQGNPGTFRFVPAGLSRTYTLRGTVTNATSKSKIVTSMLGDTSFPYNYPAAADGATMNGNFVWSDLFMGNSSSAAVNYAEWFNGYRVAGLPAKSEPQVVTSGTTGTSPTITVTAPNGGESYQIGSSVTITWTQRNVDTVTIGYKSCDSCLDWIAYNKQVDINATSGSQSWIIPSNLSSGSNYKIYIIGYKTGVGSQSDTSDGTFSIGTQTTVLTDSDNSPDYSVKYVLYGPTQSELTPQNMPDLFVRGVAKGSYDGCSNPQCNQIFGQGPDVLSPKPSTDPYSTYYDHCANSSQLNEGYVRKSTGRMSAFGFQAPAGYICQDGLFVQSTQNQSLRFLTPASGQTFVMSRDSMYISWTPALPGVDTIMLVSDTGTTRFQVYGQMVSGDPTNTMGYYIYKLPSDLSVIQPGLFHLELTPKGGGAATKSGNFTIASPLPVVPPVSGQYYIDSLLGQQASYRSGAPITFQVKALEPDGTVASQSEGFNVQAYLYNTLTGRNSAIQGVNGTYDGASGLWTVQLTAPAERTGSYEVQVSLYCGYVGFDSLCAQKYGTNKQQDRTFQFRLGTTTSSADLAVSQVVITPALNTPADKDFTVDVTVSNRTSIAVPSGTDLSVWLDIYDAANNNVYSVSSSGPSSGLAGTASYTSNFNSNLFGGSVPRTVLRFPAGTYKLVAKVQYNADSDQGNNTYTQDFALVPATTAPALAITTTNLPDATVGFSYVTQLAATGGTAPYKWSVISTTYPYGCCVLGLSGEDGLFNTQSSSTVTGPAGDYSWVIKVTGGNGSTATKTIYLKILPAPVSTLAITSPGTLPDATTGQAYSYQLQASGGSAPYSWSMISTTYPASCCILGISGGGMVNTQTSATVSTAYTGTYSWVIQVMDTNGNTATKTVYLNITQPAGPSYPVYRYLKVQSTSNSWVAWHDIEVTDSAGNILTPVSCSTSGNYLSVCEDVYPGHGSYWNAGGYSGTITLDFGSSKAISQVRLKPSNAPNPATGTHELSGSGDGSGYTSLKTFSGPYYDQQWLAYQASAVQGAFLGNAAPSQPTIARNGSFVYGYATDANGDFLTYRVNWGDGSAEETQKLASGYAYSFSHFWPRGSYTVHVTADDSRGGLSTSALAISVP